MLETIPRIVPPRMIWAHFWPAAASDSFMEAAMWA
jgi:hypothetical protein